MSEKTVITKNFLTGLHRQLAGKKLLRPTANRQNRLSMLCLLTGCLMGMWTTTTFAQSFTVQNAKTHLSDKVYRLNANLNYQFTKQALDALENGITLILALDIQVIKPRRYMWDEEIATLEQRYEIQYRALTEQYLLSNKNSGSQFMYSTLEEALSTLEKIDDLPIIDAHLLDENEYYMVQVRSRLDFDSLPVPLRLKAYFSNEWWLTSGWYSWDLTGANE